MPSINTTGAVAPLPAAAAPVRITLPGGLVVGGIVHNIGPDGLQQARAALGSLNAALAPLGPVFSIIDAFLAVKGFAEAVPELIVNPGALIEAVGELISKIARLAGLIPQLSVPLIVVGLIDAVLALLSGLDLQLMAIAAQEAKIATAAGMVATVPALGPIVEAATAQTDTARANVMASLEDLGPVMGIINVFAGLAGLGPVSIASGGGGSTAAAREAIGALVDALTVVRSAIPL